MEVYKVDSHGQWMHVPRNITQNAILGHGLAVLLGCSSHSPIQKGVMNSVVTTIGVLKPKSNILTRTGEEILKKNGLTVLWGGGDPLYKNPKRGGNIANVMQELLQRQYITTCCAVQR